MKIVDKSGKEINMIDFGMCELGKEHKFEYVLLNDTPYLVDEIKILVDYPELSAEWDKTLNPGDKGNLMFTWKPPLNHKKPLKTFFKSIYREIYK